MPAPLSALVFVSSCHGNSPMCNECAEPAVSLLRASHLPAQAAAPHRVESGNRPSRSGSGCWSCSNHDPGQAVLAEIQAHSHNHPISFQAFASIVRQSESDRMFD